MNSLFIGLGIFSFLFLFGISFVIDAIRREPRKPKRQIDWGMLDEPNDDLLFEDIDVPRDERGRFVSKNVKIEE